MTPIEDGTSLGYTVVGELSARLEGLEHIMNQVEMGRESVFETGDFHREQFHFLFDAMDGFSVPSLKTRD